MLDKIRAWRCFGLILAAGILALPLAAQAQTPGLPQSRQQIELSFAPLVKQSAPAVVSIYTRTVVRQAQFSPFLNDPIFQHFFGNALPGGVSRERVQNALGSGVIVAPDGLIVTAHHVIANADQINVVLADRREFPAKVVMNDERTDLALLRIDVKGEALPHLDLTDSDELQVGDLVLAIGNPFGVGQTVTMGIVSATARTDISASDYDFFIQTDAAINPGNSGGALITMDGRLAGINSAIYSRDGGSLGIGFAIPSAMVKRMIVSYESGGKLQHVWSGIAAQPMTSDIARSLNLPRPEGVLVAHVAADSPAAGAGIKSGDVITAVDGKEIDSPGALSYRLATLPLGGSAALTVLRDGESKDISMELRTAPENPPRDTTHLSALSPLQGATVVNLSPAVEDELELSADDKGVVIVKIDDGSTARRFGFETKDQILAVNDTRIKSVGELEDALAEGSAEGWTLTIRRGDQVMEMTINP